MGPSPKIARTLKFFRELKDRLVSVSKDKMVKEQLITDGILNAAGEWPFHEWSAEEQAKIETLEEPLNTSQVVTLLGLVNDRRPSQDTNPVFRSRRYS